MHPGGPFWAKKENGAWSIPKGEYAPPEEPLEAAIREFREETGLEAAGPYEELGSVRQAGGKIVTAWAFAGDCDPSMIASDLCRMEWPPRSGRQIEFPEIDRGRWFSTRDAMEYIVKGQIPLLRALEGVHIVEVSGHITLAGSTRRKAASEQKAAVAGASSILA